MARMDKLSQCDITIPYDHHRIHAGQSFAVFQYFTAVGASVSAEFLMVATATSADEIHAYISYSANTGPIRAYLYESPTCTGNGSVMQTRNLNRVHGVDTATVFWYHTPTAASTGAATVTIGMSYLGAASTAQTKAGPSYRSDSEVILKSNERYLLRVENISGGNANIMINVEWYEID